MIKISNTYWRAPIGFSRAKPNSFVERGFQEQYCYRDMYKQNRWMKQTLEDRQNNLKGKVKKPVFVQTWNPKTQVTMRSDMPQKTTQKMLYLLGDPLGQEWQQAKKSIDQKIEENWSKVCELWG